MTNDKKQNYNNKLNYSKDNTIVEISSKQSSIRTTNVVPPTKPKETKKEWGDSL